MLPENEKRLRELVDDPSLADRIIRIIQDDDEARRADLVRRQSEGLKNARDRGVRLGRPPAKRPRKFPSVLAMYTAGEVSARAASQMLGVSPGTFKRWVMEGESQNSED